MTNANWYPQEDVLKNSNIYQMMRKNNIDTYPDFWQWSIDDKESFLEQTLEHLGIQFHKHFSKILDLSKGVEQPIWLKDASLNIIDSCFQNTDDSVALIFQKEGGSLTKISQGSLKKYCHRIANSFKNEGLKEGDRIAIDMPMTLEAVAIYMAGIMAGLQVVTIADSFSANEISTRLSITSPKLLFTQDIIPRAGKSLPLYEKVLQAKAPKTIVISETEDVISLREGDQYFTDFLVEDDIFKSVPQDPEEHITVLFSSGTTGQPKAIPWNHITPVKCALDGYFHQNIQQGDVVCWPTNLGWMMGPWLIFAALINKASIALYYGAPVGEGFGQFVQDAKVNMLGLVPSLVRQWKHTASMERFDWSAIKCFSSTGEASNPEEMDYLMQLGNNKPVIEYCGGTEIGGGYVTSTMVQPNIASTFSTQALGGEFVLLDEEGQPSDQGEMYLIPPILGLSNTLLNRDHHEVYFKGNPSYHGKTLRKHGDELIRLENGYFKAQGRADDAMNLGGIKVSSLQIEEVINELSFVNESAAIAVSPKDGGPSKLYIYIVAKDADISLQEKLKEARSIIRNRLNPLFKVEELLEIDLLPRTASGKVMRRKLRDKLSN